MTVYRVMIKSTTERVRKRLPRPGPYDVSAHSKVEAFNNVIKMLGNRDGVSYTWLKREYTYAEIDEMVTEMAEQPRLF